MWQRTPGVLHECPEQLEFRRRHVDFLPFFGDSVRNGIENDISNGDRAVRNLQPGSEAADRGTQTRCQFRKLEWLGDVVVGSRIQSLDLIFLFVAHREHEYGEKWKQVPYAPASFHTADAGHVDVK